jgi:hypothetical protein
MEKKELKFLLWLHQQEVESLYDGDDRTAGEISRIAEEYQKIFLELEYE